MADLALSGAATRDNRRSAIGSQVPPELVCIIAAIGDQPPQPTRCSCDDLRGGFYVACIARCEVDYGRAAEDVGDDVDLRGLAATRDADGLRLRPPLPPWAERWALM